MSVSKLQELRSATVASPCRWQRAVETGEDVDERAAHALGVEHDILVEEPPLQGIATLAALTLKSLDLTLQDIESLLMFSADSRV